MTNKLSNCKTLTDVKASDYDAIFYVGGEIPRSRSGMSIRQWRCWIGHGPVIDLAKDPKNAELVETVGLLSLAGASWNNERAILVVLEEWLIGRCCLPRTRVSV